MEHYCSRSGPANMFERRNASELQANQQQNNFPPGRFFSSIVISLGAGIVPACREATVRLKPHLCLFRLSVLLAGGQTPPGVWLGAINCRLIQKKSKKKKSTCWFLCLILKKPTGTALLLEVIPQDGVDGACTLPHWFNTLYFDDFLDFLCYCAASLAESGNCVPPAGWLA